MPINVDGPLHFIKKRVHSLMSITFKKLFTSKGTTRRKILACFSAIHFSKLNRDGCRNHLHAEILLFDFISTALYFIANEKYDI